MWKNNLIKSNLSWYTQQSSKKGNFINLIKDIYENPTNNIILTGKRLKALPHESGKNTRISALLSLPFDIILEALARQLGNKNKQRHPDFKGRKTIFTDGIILYLENAKEFTRKKTSPIRGNKFSKVVGNKINIQ